MGSRLFIILTSPGRTTMGLGLFFVLVSLGGEIGSAYALSGLPLKIPPRSSYTVPTCPTPLPKHRLPNKVSISNI
jgi:hypothetical protein